MSDDPDILHIGGGENTVEVIHWESGDTTLSIGREALATFSPEETSLLADFLSKAAEK